MRTETIRLYEGREDVTLTTYLLDDSPELLKGGARPAIVICPGGAYLNCSDREAEPVALRFAAMGYHAFVLRYSVYQEGCGGTPDWTKPIEPKLQCQYPKQMREMGMAMRLIKSKAEEWYVDPERITICGFSAGAHNCAMYSVNWNQPVITEYFSETAEIFRPAAVILGYPLTNLSWLYAGE